MHPTENVTSRVTEKRVKILLKNSILIEQAHNFLHKVNFFQEVKTVTPYKTIDSAGT